MPGEKANTMALRYLFRAHFSDGTTFEQSPDDAAVLAHDRRGTGSSFTDLLWLVETEDKLVDAFVLFDAEKGHGVLAVMLKAGFFELGGNQFYVGQDGLGDDVLRRLVYFRQVTRQRTQTVDTKTGEALDEAVEQVFTRYYVGWQATVNGRNVEAIVGIDE